MSRPVPGPAGARCERPLVQRPISTNPGASTRRLTLIALALGATAILAACGGSDASALTGKLWQLTAISEKVPAFQGVIPPDQQANDTIEFKADGTFAARADCNNVADTYTTADPTAASGDLALAPGPTILVACAAGSYSDLCVLALNNTAS